MQLKHRHCDFAVTAAARRRTSARRDSSFQSFNPETLSKGFKQPLNPDEECGLKLDDEVRLCV
jgi:hypothetical protein